MVTLETIVYEELISSDVETLRNNHTGKLVMYTNPHRSCTDVSFFLWYRTKVWCVAGTSHNNGINESVSHKTLRNSAWAEPRSPRAVIT